MAINISGLVGRFARTSNTTAAPLRQTGLTSAAVAQVEPPYTDSARAGLAYIGGTGIIANGIAPVAAIPTTTATLALWNGDASKSLVIDYIHLFLGSGTAAATLTLLATVSTSQTATPPTAATGYSISGAAGQARQSKARFATAQTLSTTPIAPAWVAVGSNLQVAAANVGMGDQPFLLEGRLVVPPAYMLGLAILSGAGTTPLYSVSVRWTELDLDLE